MANHIPEGRPGGAHTGGPPPDQGEMAYREREDVMRAQSAAAMNKLTHEQRDEVEAYMNAETAFRDSKTARLQNMTPEQCDLVLPQPPEALGPQGPGPHRGPGPRPDGPTPPLQGGPHRHGHGHMPGPNPDGFAGPAGPPPPPPEGFAPGGPGMPPPHPPNAPL